LEFFSFVVMVPERGGLFRLLQEQNVSLHFGEKGSGARDLLLNTYEYVLRSRSSDPFA
jgi:hypothetical protein